MSAQYDNRYAIKINPATPNLRGLTTNYDNTGQTNLGGVGLGDLYELDYDRDTIEKVFNQGTDAQYALMQKENQIAQNQYANNQFANQQSAIETLRQQRNEQIASGMARGLNAAQEQGTVLGLQQEGAAGALELANKQQLAADEIAAAYAENVVKALEEANAVKQAMAGISAQLYEADMLGYTGELSAAAQMDANASNRYGSELGYEGTIYTAEKKYQAARYAADMGYAGTIGAANINASAQRYAANVSAATQKALANAQKTEGVDISTLVKTYSKNPEQLQAELKANGVDASLEESKNMTNNYWAQQLGFANYNALKTYVDDNTFGSNPSTIENATQQLINSFKKDGHTENYNYNWNWQDTLGTILPWNWGDKKY